MMQIGGGGGNCNSEYGRLIHKSSGGFNHKKGAVFKDKTKQRHATKTLDSKGVQCGVTQGASGSQNCVRKSEFQQRKSFSISIFVSLFAFTVLFLGICLGVSLGQLRDSKTATGVLSFSLPPTAGATGFNLFISGDEVYAGNSATCDKITSDSNNSFALFVKKNASNSTADAYFKLTLTFYGCQDIDYNGGNTYFKNLNNENDALLSYQGKDTTSIENSVVFTFTTSTSLSNYSKLVFDAIFAGFECSVVNLSNILEVGATIYSDSAKTSQTSSTTTICKYSSAVKLDVAFSTVGDKCQVQGNNFALNTLNYCFDVIVVDGYEPQVSGLPTGYTSSVKGNTISYTVPNVTSNLNFVVSTTPIVYTIAFDANGGDAIANLSYTIESETFTLPTPTRSGGGFIGWTGSNGTTPEMTVTITQGTIGNKSYIANWREYYTITFEDNGTGGLTYLAYAIDTSEPDCDDKTLWTQLTSDTSLTSVSINVPVGMNLYINSNKYHYGYEFYSGSTYVDGCMNNVGYYFGTASFTDITADATYTMKGNACKEPT